MAKKKLSYYTSQPLTENDTKTVKVRNWGTLRQWSSLVFRLSSPDKRHNSEKPPLEEEKKEKIELKSITSDGETNTATKVHIDIH